MTNSSVVENPITFACENTNEYKRKYEDRKEMFGHLSQLHDKQTRQSRLTDKTFTIHIYTRFDNARIYTRFDNARI